MARSQSTTTGGRMFRTTRVISAVGLAAGITAVAATLMAKDGVQVVQVRDDCDPATFNAAIGPGTCVGDGDTLFQDFVADVLAQQSVDKWRFNPDRVSEARDVVAMNRGGETHTFTRVEEFADGSIAPPLENLLGNPAIAPECAAAVPLRPGATQKEPFDPTQSNKFQCCIHPWMRTTIGAKH